jgi:hypothetical protein
MIGAKSWEYASNQQKYMVRFWRSDVALYMSSQDHQTRGDYDRWIDLQFPTIELEDREKLKRSVWPCQICSFVLMDVPKGHRSGDRPVAVDVKFARLIPKLWERSLETLSWEWFEDQNAFCFTNTTLDGRSTQSRLAELFGFRLANLACYENGSCYFHFDDRDLEEMMSRLNCLEQTVGRVILNRFEKKN